MGRWAGMAVVFGALAVLVSAGAAGAGTVGEDTGSVVGGSSWEMRRCP
jgi:hypothetical protein